MTTELTQEIVREFLDYDPESGILTWKIRQPKWFKSKGYCLAWNRKFAGKEASCIADLGKYSRIIILYNQRLTHRVIWLWMTGEWPDQIDHINGRTNDNRWLNLRNVNQSGNQKNTKINSTNTSGIVGVCRASNGSNWAVEARDLLGKKRKWCFKEKSKAILRRKAAEILFGYHPNHGRPE